MGWEGERGGLVKKDPELNFNCEHHTNMTTILDSKATSVIVVACHFWKYIHSLSVER